MSTNEATEELWGHVATLWQKAARSTMKREPELRSTLAKLRFHSMAIEQGALAPHRLNLRPGLAAYMQIDEGPSSQLVELRDRPQAHHLKPATWQRSIALVENRAQRELVPVVARLDHCGPLLV